MSSRTSREVERFGFYLRYGLVLPDDERESKFNPYRADDGRYDFAPGNGTLPPRKRSSDRVAMAAGVQKPAATGSEWQGPVRPYPPAKPQQPVRRRPAGLSDDIIAAAQVAQSRYGVPASVTLAQFGLESGWGRRMPPGSNNPFGIKARPGEPFVTIDTLEQDRHGRVYRIKAKFRKYRSLNEAFEAHAQLLQQPAYVRAQSARTAEEYADALTGVYATDRQYGSKLKALIHQHGLNDFNLTGARR